MTSRFAMVVLSVAVSACGVLPVPQDGGLVTVPLQYRLAKNAPGHEQHLNLKGKDQVRCRDCHAVSDAGFSTPPVDQQTSTPSSA